MNKFTATPAHGTFRSAFKLNPVAAGCAVFVSAMATSAFAQDATPAQAPVADAPVQQVTVTGIRRGIEAAIDVKKNASSIVETISAEDIGKLPDTTIAESLARLPGLTAQRTKSGAASNISIRGLGPDFNGYLLNGREQTSTGDSRAVDLSAYPAELIAGATVYKTSDATVMGAGLAGTIDQNLIDPLAFGKRVVTVSYERLRSGVGLPVEGKGNRASLTYVDQFADRKIGIALGFVRVDGNSSSVEKGNWGDKSVAATAPDGSSLGTVKVAGFGSGLGQQTNDTTDKRTGVAAILAFKPNREFNTQLDLFYSKMDLNTKKNIVKAELGGPITNAVVSGGEATAGTFALGASPKGLINYIENVFDNDEIKSLGWRSSLKMSETTRATFDVSHNSAERIEKDIEYYAGIAAADTLSFVNSGGSTKFTLGNPAAYTDPATMQLRDQTGWSGVNGLAQAGYSKGPTITDKVDAVRLDFKTDLADGSFFTDITYGANYTKRTKDRVTDEGVLISTANNGADRVAFPAGSYVYNNVGETGLNMLTFDPTNSLVPGITLKRKYNDDILSKTWSVREKVTTAFVKARLETTVSGIPVTGNVGAQVVNTNQESDGYRAAVGSGVVLTNPAPNGLSTAGTSYVDVLPSLNLTGDFSNGKFLRLGVSEQIARASMTDMRNSGAASIIIDPSNPAIDGTYSGSSGNPNLKPFKAMAFDLSAEKYFGKRGYVSGALFYKKLDTYITKATDTQHDFNAFVAETNGAPGKNGNIGTYTTMVNGSGGNLYGYELTASVPFDMLASWLSGFGASTSYSNTSSSVSLPDLTGLNPTQPVPAGNAKMPLPGLSKDNAKLTLYFEKNGFSAFVAGNYRSKYIGDVANDAIGGYPTPRYIDASSWVSAQIGYEFQSGVLKGLGFRLQGNNLNSPVYRQLKADGSELSSSKTGRSISFKISYKM